MSAPSVVVSMGARAAAALEAIERLASDGCSAQQVVENVAERIVGVIDADAFFVGATDPDTDQLLGAAIDNFAAEVRHPYFLHEFSVPDYNKFVDLTAADPVGDLREATGGRLSRSARYRVLNAIAGLEDELRATLRAGGRPSGKLQLNRRTGREPFTEAERAFLGAAAPLAGAALRRAILQQPADTDPNRGPGVVIVDEAGTVINSTAEAEAWLREMTAGSREYSTHIGIDAELLLMPLSTPTEADASPPHVRLRTRGGTWLVAHASPLDEPGKKAIVIEPAKASEIVAIIVEAYGLTNREVEVTRLVARGLSTDEIASALFLSRHTVRDHVKAIFQKVGVSSRGELTSKLFAEPYHAPRSDTSHRSDDRVTARLELVREAA